MVCGERVERGNRRCGGDAVNEREADRLGQWSPGPGVLVISVRSHRHSNRPRLQGEDPGYDPSGSSYGGEWELSAGSRGQPALQPAATVLPGSARLSLHGCEAG